MHIHRVATQISINQEGNEAKGGDPTCVGSACRRSAVLPLYSYGVRQNRALKRFVKRPRFESGDQVVPSLSPASSTSSDDDVQDRSLLDTVILAQWEDRFERGLFRYDVTACPTKVLDGVYGFVAQLNEGRATKKRPTEYSIDKVVQAFDPQKFNFTKADEKELLLQFESREARPLPAARGDCSRQTTYCEKAKIEGSPNVVVINVSPIEYGHVLLVPRVMDSLPQMLTPELLLTALHFTAEAANPYFRVGYNSLGAYATINHCHFQAYFLTAHFPIERAPASPLASAAGCRHHASLGGASVQRLAHFPVRSLVYELGSSLEELARAVGAACVALQQMDVAFNVLIVDRGARVFLMPNKFATRVANGEIPDDVLETGINPAVFEIAGHLLYKRPADYEAATQDFAWRLLEQASLTEGEFDDLVEKLLPRKGFRSSEWSEA